ncbi:MAG TPA: ABC transporter permease [Solirubrobacteraceae bacterium]|nr:ABC transporter permease [Solirubrobacteraceae bacterium]
MRAAAALAFAGMRAAPGRTLVRILVLSLAVALLGAMLLFVGASLRTMTSSAVRSVPLHWQGPVGSYQQAGRVAADVAAQRGVKQSAPAATAPLTGATHSGPRGTTSAGASSVLAVPPDYATRFHTFRYLQGSLLPGQVVLDQQLASTLQARIGDRVSLVVRANAPPQSFKVSGIAVVTAGDKLFQPLDPRAGPAAAQPPADVVVMPIATFAQTLAPSLHAITQANAGSSAVPGAQQGIQWQVQVQVDQGQLGQSPSQALTQAEQLRRRAERSLPGQVQFVDNLAEQLTTASGDALYAEALYIMLAVPGALIALGLAYLAALGTVERDRRDLALLRARGASRRDLIALAGIESGVIGLLAGLVGAGLAFLATDTLVTGGIDASAGRVVVTILVCLALAVGGALVARLAATASVWRKSVVAARRSAQRESRPLWQRLYLDVACLIASGLIYWLTASTGFSAVVNPDSNPTLSLSVYMFFAPALLWIGAALLLVRLRGRVLGRGLALMRRVLSRGKASDSSFILTSAGRRGPAINRGLLAVGLLLAFGVNLGIFAATYNQQVNVDAQLTLGADVVATAPPGVAQQHNLASKVAGVPGVAATSAVEHSYAYVGPDLQDTYGVNAATLGNATTLRDSYFIGDTAQGALARLRATPDGILVSKETIKDYSVVRGDLLRLRVLDRQTGKFHVVNFHVAGIVQEFPSAPKDSFMVANLSYLQAADHGGGPNVVFAKANGDPPAVASRVAAATGGEGTQVKNIRQQSAQTVSSITTVDLSGVTSIERAFVILLAAAAMALLIALGMYERRREFATMAAVGASVREIAAYVWSEAAIVLVAATALAALLGWLLAEMLVAMLQHVFDPPPDHLAVPWGFLGGMFGAAALATLVAVVLAGRGLRRLPLGQLLRDE